MTAAPDPLVGRTLVGRYRIEALIGRGGLGFVYRATDERLGRPVAVKVVSLPSEAGERRTELRARLRREAGSAARIPPHPNVVQVYDHGTDAELDLDFIAMELVPGRDLKGALREGPLAPGAAVRVQAEAARGVAAGHRVGIVHRDVKPANIVLVGEHGNEGVKILDFGIAKALEAVDEELTRTGATPHSPAYASPEQLRGEATLTPASDVYQLGLVGYELLAGERAGPALGGDPAGRWEAVPAATRAVIERALRRDPAERFADASEFAAALPAPGPDDETVALPAGGAGASARRRIEARHGAQLAVAGLLVLLGLWIVLRATDGGGGEEAAAPTLEAAELDVEFRPLLAEANARLVELASPTEGQEAAEAVEATVRELTRAWVDGDIERHAEHYDDRVRFYGRTLSRAAVARARAESLVRYPEREITLDRVAIRFPEPGRAEALVDKSWSFGGDEEAWEGAARQRFDLELRGGRWRVVGERDLEVYRSERDEG